MLLFLNFILVSNKFFFNFKYDFKLLFNIFSWWFGNKISFIKTLYDFIYYFFIKLGYYIIRFFIKKPFDLTKKLNPFSVRRVLLFNANFKLKHSSLYGFVLGRNKFLDSTLLSTFISPIYNHYQDFNFFRLNRHLTWLLFFSKPKKRTQLWISFKSLSPQLPLSKILYLFAKRTLLIRFRLFLLLILGTLLFLSFYYNLENFYVDLMSTFFLWLNELIRSTFLLYLICVSLNFFKTILFIIVFDFIDILPFKSVFESFLYTFEAVLFYFSLPNINYMYTNVDLGSNFSLQNLLLKFPFVFFNFIKAFVIIVFCFSLCKFIFYFLFGFIINLKMSFVGLNNASIVNNFWSSLNKFDDCVTRFENHLNIYSFLIWWYIYIYIEFFIKWPVLLLNKIIKSFYYFILRIPYLILFAVFSLHFLIFLPLVIFWLLETSVVNYICSSISLFIFPGSSPWLINNILGTLHDLFPRFDYNFIFTYFDPFSYDSILESLRYSDDDRRFIQDLFLNILATDRIENDDEFYNSLSLRTNQNNLKNDPLNSLHLNLLDQNEDVESYHDLFEDYSSLELLFRLENCMNNVVNYLVLLDEKLKNRSVYVNSDDTLGSINRRSEDVLISYSIFWRLKIFFRLFVVVIWLWQVKIFF